MGGAVIGVVKTENLCLSMTVMIMQYSIHQSGSEAAGAGGAHPALRHPSGPRREPLRLPPRGTPSKPDRNCQNERHHQRTPEQPAATK